MPSRISQICCVNLLSEYPFKKNPQKLCIHSAKKFEMINMGRLFNPLIWTSHANHFCFHVNHFKYFCKIDASVQESEL